jgi:hypothetical protein
MINGLLGRENQTVSMAAVLFGLTQWLVIVPLIWRMKPGRNTLIGLLITAGIGFLLSSSCGAMMYPTYVAQRTRAEVPAPHVTAISPDAGATNVPTTVQVRIQFDAAVLASSASGILLLEGAQPVRTKLQFGEGQTVVTLIPTEPLHERTEYSVKVAGVTRSFGGQTNPAYFQVFTTGGAEKE